MAEFLFLFTDVCCIRNWSSVNKIATQISKPTKNLESKSYIVETCVSKIEEIDSKGFHEHCSRSFKFVKKSVICHSSLIASHHPAG
jgi:hypothetical protein